LEGFYGARVLGRISIINGREISLLFLRVNLPTPVTPFTIKVPMLMCYDENFKVGSITLITDSITFF
jgi:hypothetical protein